jgi:hypothetical protein
VRGAPLRMGGERVGPAREDFLVVLRVARHRERRAELLVRGFEQPLALLASINHHRVQQKLEDGSNRTLRNVCIRCSTSRRSFLPFASLVRIRPMFSSDEKSSGFGLSARSQTKPTLT